MKITSTKAITLAIQKEMELDERVIILGEDIINFGGSMGIFRGLPEKFPDRCLDMPVAENGFVQFGNGCALAGLRPIVDLAYSDFSLMAADAIINTTAKMCFENFGKTPMPMVITMANGGMATYGSTGSGCNHAQCVENIFANVPGLKIVMPYFPSDMLGLMRSAIRDNDPVLFLYHKATAGRRESMAAKDLTELEDDEYIIPLNNAGHVIREGSDVTIVALQSMIPVALDAAQELEAEGIQAEVIDPRVLMPFDTETVLKSVRKTGKLIVVQEAHSRGGFGCDIVAEIAQAEDMPLKKPAKIIGALNTPIPSGFAECMMMPHKEDVIAAVKALQ